MSMGIGEYKKPVPEQDIQSVVKQQITAQQPKQDTTKQTKTLADIKELLILNEVDAADVIHIAEELKTDAIMIMTREIIMRDLTNETK